MRNTVQQSPYKSRDLQKLKLPNAGKYQPQRQKTYPRICEPSLDSDQPAHSHSLIRIFTRRILDRIAKDLKFLHVDNEELRLC